MNRHSTKLLILAAVAILALAGCAGGSDSTISTFPNLAGTDAAPPVPELDREAVAAGIEIYGQYCALCHADDLSGEPNWRTPNADGSYPAPPHDSSGHTWHHSDRLLLEIVRDGSGAAGSRMPTFGGQLTEEQIQAVLAYIKSSWGPEERAFQWQVTWQESQRSE